MTSVMPVPLLAAHPRECSPQDRTRDMYLLPALAAGLVRCIYIDCLDKLSEGIGGQFREGAVPLYPLNKLIYILCLLFLFMNLLLQTLYLGFEVFLLLGIVLAHHRKAFIIQTTG